MSYLVLARAWRPQRFDEVVGQAHVTRTLSNAIRTGRVAHAFLFTGVRGVGKTSMARILAKSLNCKNGPTVDPCGACDSCRAVAAGTSVDVIEIDGASNNSVDDVRELRETVPYRPVLGRFKIYVVDEVHMLSLSAFNALLKTLEEPPPHVKFIFATTEPHKIPVTILSRCQRYDFRRIPTSAIIERVRTILASENIPAEEAALAIIGREAEGSMRDALSILDQVLATGTGAITAEAVADLLGVVDRQVLYDLSLALIRGDARRCLEIVRDVDRQGYDILVFVRGLLEHLRNLVVVAVCGGDRALLDVPDAEIDDLKSQAGSCSRDTLHRLFKHLSEAYEVIARSSRPRILLEATLARSADLGDLAPAADILRRLEALAGDAGPGGSSPATGSGSGERRAADAPARDAGSSRKPARQKAQVCSSRAGSPVADWEDMLSDLRRERPLLASIYERAVPSQVDAPDVLVVRFDRSDDFSAAAADQPEHRRGMESFLLARYGRPVRLVIRRDEAIAEAPAVRRRLQEEEEARRREDEARQHPLVRLALSELGGQIARVALKTEPGPTEA